MWCMNKRLPLNDLRHLRQPSLFTHIFATSLRQLPSRWDGKSHQYLSLAWISKDADGYAGGGATIEEGWKLWDKIDAELKVTKVGSTPRAPKNSNWPTHQHANSHTDSPPIAGQSLSNPICQFLHQKIVPRSRSSSRRPIVLAPFKMDLDPWTIFTRLSSQAHVRGRGRRKQRDGTDGAAALGRREGDNVWAYILFKITLTSFLQLNSNIHPSIFPSNSRIPRALLLLVSRNDQQSKKPQCKLSSPPSTPHWAPTPPTVCPNKQSSACERRSGPSQATPSTSSTKTDTKSSNAAAKPSLSRIERIRG
jgi:hypothetical protein